MALLQMDWKPNRSALQRFGFSFAVSALVFGVVIWLLDASPLLSAILGSALALTGLLIALLPQSAARPLYLAIMVPSFLLGSIVSRILVGLLYFLVVTPIGLALRLRKHDPLALKQVPGSAFVPSPAQDDSPDSYERSF